MQNSTIYKSMLQNKEDINVDLPRLTLKTSSTYTLNLEETVSGKVYNVAFTGEFKNLQTERVVSLTITYVKENQTFTLHEASRKILTSTDPNIPFSINTTCMFSQPGTGITQLQVNLSANQSNRVPHENDRVLFRASAWSGGGQS
jgi:hypothetical protein